jgi:hypothetical protein
MRPTYKQRCIMCKKEMVLINYKNQKPICYNCQKKDLVGEIKDPAMKKLFRIPEALFKDSSFLRSIKINYLRYGSLTDKQIAAFKKVVERMKNKEE